MRPEVILAAGYCALLLVAALLLEWLSAHTHRRSLRYRTAGFTYDEQQDHWECPEGQHLWPHDFDHERRLVRYRAKAHICNGCPLKDACTDSDQGRELIRPLDPWPHSEAGRFHRGLSLMLIGLVLLILVIESARHHRPEEAALLLALLATGAVTALRLLRDFRTHPANFPTATTAHSLGKHVTAADGQRAARRWASYTRRED